MPTVVVIGASSKRHKFGNKCVRLYKEEGWNVIPINPRESSIEGIPTRASINEVDEPIDRVSLYLAPDQLAPLLPDIASKNPGDVFFNPGTENPDVFNQALKLGMNAVRSCAIVALGRSPSEAPDS